MESRSIDRGADQTQVVLVSVSLLMVLVDCHHGDTWHSVLTLSSVVTTASALSSETVCVSPLLSLWFRNQSVCVCVYAIFVVPHSDRECVMSVCWLHCV